MQVIRRAITPFLAMNASLSYLHPLSFPFSSSFSAEGERSGFKFSSVSEEGGRRRVEVEVAEGRCKRRV